MPSFIMIVAPGICGAVGTLRRWFDRCIATTCTQASSFANIPFSSRLMIPNGIFAVTTFIVHFATHSAWLGIVIFVNVRTRLVRPSIATMLSVANFYLITTTCNEKIKSSCEAWHLYRLSNMICHIGTCRGCCSSNCYSWSSCSSEGVGGKWNYHMILSRLL